MSNLYEQGRYVGRVTRQAMGQTKNGNAQFVLSFDLLGRVNPADPDGSLIACQSGERSIFRVITDKTIDYVVEDLKILGYTKSSFRFLDPQTAGYEDFTGQEITVSCHHEEYDGKTRERWGFAKDGAGVQVKPLDSKAMRNLDSLFGKALKGLETNGTKPAPKPDAYSEPIENDPAVNEPDEIPFSFLLPFGLFILSSWMA